MKFWKQKFHTVFSLEAQRAKRTATLLNAGCQFYPVSISTQINFFPTSLRIGTCFPARVYGLVRLFSITSEPLSAIELTRKLSSHKRNYHFDLDLTRSEQIEDDMNYRARRSFNVTKFLVISTQKSGSTWFVRRLGTHPDIMTLQIEPLNRPVQRCLEESGHFCPWKTVESVLVSNFRKLLGQSISPSDGTTELNEKRPSILGFKVEGLPVEVKNNRDLIWKSIRI